jgi:hypothetical protein
MVASVTTIEGAFTNETSPPLTAPKAEPTAMPATGSSQMGSPCRASNPQQTPQIANSEPTEMSISATTITSVMPIEISSTGRFASATSRKLPNE